MFAATQTLLAAFGLLLAMPNVQALANETSAYEPPLLALPDATQVTPWTVGTGMPPFGQRELTREEVQHTAKDFAYMIPYMLGLNERIPHKHPSLNKVDLETTFNFGLPLTFARDMAAPVTSFIAGDAQEAEISVKTFPIRPDWGQNAWDGETYPNLFMDAEITLRPTTSTLPNAAPGLPSNCIQVDVKKLNIRVASDTPETFRDANGEIHELDMDPALINIENESLVGCVTPRGITAYLFSEQ